MALLKILGGNLTAAANFDIYIDANNVRRISATNTTIVINYAGSAAGTQTITVTIPSDTTGTFQREFIATLLGADKSISFSEAPPTFTNGQTAASNKITSVAIA
jgi:hypothetical protein